MAWWRLVERLMDPCPALCRRDVPDQGTGEAVAAGRRRVYLFLICS